MERNPSPKRRQTKRTEMTPKFNCPFCEYARDLFSVESILTYLDHLEGHRLEAVEDLRKIEAEIKRIKNLPQ